jgi:hypothetical protein
MIQISIFHLDDVNLMRYNGCIICFLLEIDNGGRLKKLYYKRDDFTFPIFNFSFISSNTPPACGDHISPLIRYSRVCAQYSDCLGCLHRSWSTKTTLLPCWSSRFKYSTVVMTTWLIITKYSYLILQWIFYFYVDLFSFLFHCQEPWTHQEKCIFLQNIFWKQF